MFHLAELVVLVTSLYIFVFIVVVSVVFSVAIPVVYCYAALLRKYGFSTYFLGFVDLPTVHVAHAVLCVSDTDVVVLVTPVCIFVFIVVVSVVV